MEARTRWDTVEGGAMKGEHGDMKKDSTRAHPTNPAFWLPQRRPHPSFCLGGSKSQKLKPSQKWFFLAPSYGAPVN